MRKETSKIIELTTPLLGFTKLELVGHARIQMKARGISITDVIHTIGSPTQKDGLPTQPGRKRYRWNKSVRQAIDVVFELLEDRIRVITTITITRRLIERKKRNG